jgi:hypothetical protein
VSAADTDKFIYDYSKYRPNTTDTDYLKLRVQQILNTVDILTAVAAIVPSCPQRNLYLILCLSIWQGIQRRAMREEK